MILDHERPRYWNSGWIGWNNDKLIQQEDDRLWDDEPSNRISNNQPIAIKAEV